MNLNGIAASYTRVINPPITATLRVSTGSVKNADYSRTPAYRDFPRQTVDVQALTASQIQHLDALNIQGILRSAYFNGVIEGLDRPAGKGGDLLIFGGRTWLCVHVLEAWDTGGWVKVAIQLQTNP